MKLINEIRVTLARELLLFGAFLSLIKRGSYYSGLWKVLSLRKFILYTICVLDDAISLLFLIQICRYQHDSFQIMWIILKLEISFLRLFMILIS